MKHFILTLLCVGTCLAAVAAPPRIKAKADVVINKFDKVDLRRDLPTLPRQYRSIIKVDEKVMTPQRFFTEFGVTPDDNQLLKKAPRRVSPDMVATPKVAFMNNYEYSYDDDAIVQSKNYYDGGWDVDMAEIDDGVYYAYLYYNQIPVTIYADYNDNTAEMEMGCVGGWQWTDTTSTGYGTRKTYYVNDTTMYLFVLDENYFMSDNDEPCNVNGTIYNDGSLYFPDGYCFYVLNYVTTQKYNNNWLLQNTTNDTTEYMLTPFYHDTYLLTPNATHSYDIMYDVNDIEHNENNIYMYQYDDSIALVWNLWQLGGKDNFMYIREDGSMTFPIGQSVGTDNVDYLEEAYPDYDWSEGYDIIVVNYDSENDTYSNDDITGEVTPHSISWEGSQLWRYCLYNNEYYVLQHSPMINNVLTFTNDDYYFLLGYAEAPTITSEVYEDYVLVNAVTESDNSVVYLFDSNGNIVDNPYRVDRTLENQELTFYAIAAEYGKNQSEMVEVTVFIPALDIFLPGDVDNNGTINLKDVITLIDHLLNNDFNDTPTFCSENADINMDGTFTVADVSELISRIVNEP